MSIIKYTAKLPSPYPLSEVSNQLFSLTRNNQTFNFRIDIYSISSQSLTRSFATKGVFLRESATIFLLENNDEQRMVAQYCHGYGPCSNMSSFYGYIVGQSGGEQDDNSFEHDMFANFTKAIQKHFELNWKQN
ncbi:predicted protein [Naegleria gruberi]|uniref:Predicted protein n=1 Tax=Naegleria gruberi TaxID=5762 RepID=D2W3A1_NAEGR|nr:uncharacterized protein NAEGRDRAFT_75873 [Naegleria gruberi]EFC36481.1 predicted protein [Naegleria gruberi]|eukprot:XP_002669225.1 predicted protein [Naegleria gruberi strain NEG-M]